MADCVRQSNGLHSDWVAQEITPRRSAGSEIPACISETAAALTLYKDNCRAARDSKDIKTNKFNKANRLITAWLQIIRDYRKALTGIVPETGAQDPASTIQYYFGGPEWGGMDIPEVNGVSETMGSEFCIQPKLPLGQNDSDDDVNLNTEYKDCRRTMAGGACLDKRLPGVGKGEKDTDEFPSGGYNNRLIKQHMCINMGVSTLHQGGDSDGEDFSGDYMPWYNRTGEVNSSGLPRYPVIPGHASSSADWIARKVGMKRLCTKDGNTDVSVTLSGNAGTPANPIYCNASFSRESGYTEDGVGMCTGVSAAPMPGSRIYRCKYNNAGLTARLNEFSGTDIAKGKFIDAIENLHNGNGAAEVSSSEEYKQYFVEKYNESLPSDGAEITLADISRPLTATEWDADVTKIQGILSDADLDTPEWQEDPAGKDATNRGLSLKGQNYGNWIQHTGCPDEKCPLVAVTQAMPNCCQNTINVSGDDINLEDINQSCGIEDDSGGSSGGSSTSEAALRAELSAMGLSALLPRAVSSGVPGNLLDDINDSEDPKAAIIDLIVRFKKDEPGIWQMIVNFIREITGSSEGFTVNKIDNKSYTTNPMLFIFLVILISFIFINKNKIIKKFKQMLN
jgi:hypothetical protein